MNLKSQREILSLSLFLIVLEGDLRSIGSSSNIRAFLFFPFPPFATSVFPSAYQYHQGRLFASSPFQVLYFSILFFFFFFSVPPTKTEVAPRVVDSPFKPIVALPTPDFISSSPQPCALTELVTRYYFEFRSLLLTATQSHANTLLRVFVFSPFLCRASLIWLGRLFSIFFYCLSSNTGDFSAEFFFCTREIFSFFRSFVRSSVRLFVCSFVRWALY